MNDFVNRFWISRDGLKLHYRDYAGPDGRPVVLCLPGLTRNARDFSHVAERLAGRWRVICPDLRGRGESAYAKDSATYTPLQYADDLDALFKQAELGPAVFMGTSLGGLLTMITALTHPGRVAAALLNDVGPELEAAGLERIRGYVGQGRSFPTWVHAARALEDSQAVAFPDYQIADWLDMAKRCMVVGSNGRIVFDYDMKIAEPIAQPASADSASLWPALAALAGKPVALLRGGLSDILAPEVHLRMAQMLPGSDAVTVPDVGHAPVLNEAEAMAAIDRLLARVEAATTK